MGIKKDIGFWGTDGVYIPDIQEVDEMEMDKEIIIDGVDVAGCRYHRMNNQMVMCTACNSGKGSPYCKYENNCYYKQLQRANQEIDLLEQLKDNDSVRVVNLIEENRKLETEKERLKEDLECAIQNVENLLGFKKQLKAENERLKAEFRIESLTDKTTRETIYRSNLVNKYRATLQEIKEIAETAINGGCATKSDDYSEGMEIIGHYVLQKITKAEEE